MADKAEKKPEAAAPAAAPTGDKKEGGKKGGGLLTKTPVLLVIAMIIQAGVLFAGFWMFGRGPKAAAGADLTTEHTTEGGESHGGDSGHGAATSEGHGDPADKGKSPADKKKSIVIKVTEFKAPNKKNGNTFLFDLKICVVSKGEFQQRIEDAIKEREPLIQDRIRTIIGNSDPEKISGGEPGLETFRRQVKYQLDEIIGEGIIDEVLIPRCIPFRTDY